MLNTIKIRSKKIFVVALVIALSSTLLSSCSSSKEGGKQPSIQNIVEEINNKVDISTMKEGDNDKLQKLYDIDDDKLEDFVLYTAPTNIEADEILILKVKDEKDLNNIKDKISKRVEEQSDSFKDYLPDEYYLIEKHILKEHDKYIIFVISEHSEEIENIFDKSFK